MSRVYSYATVSDVQEHVSVATFTASSKPNATQVITYIQGASDELDAKLAALEYATPVATGATQAFTLLQQWTGIGAAMYAVAALPQGEKGNHLAFLERRWTTILDKLDEGAIQIPGLAKSSTGLPRFGSVTDSDGNASPYFTRSADDFQ